MDQPHFFNVFDGSVPLSSEMAGFLNDNNLSAAAEIIRTNPAIQQMLKEDFNTITSLCPDAAKVYFNPANANVSNSQYYGGGPSDSNQIVFGADITTRLGFDEIPPINTPIASMNLAQQLTLVKQISDAVHEPGHLIANLIATRSSRARRPDQYYRIEGETKTRGIQAAIDAGIPLSVVNMYYKDGVKLDSSGHFDFEATKIYWTKWASEKPRYQHEAEVWVKKPGLPSYAIDWVHSNPTTLWEDFANVGLKRYFGNDSSTTNWSTHWVSDDPAYTPPSSTVAYSDLVKAASSQALAAAISKAVSANVQIDANSTLLTADQIRDLLNGAQPVPTESGSGAGFGFSSGAVRGRAITTVNDASLLRYDLDGNLVSTAAAAMIPVFDPVSGKTTYTTLYAQNPQTGKLTPLVNAMGNPSNGNINTFDNNGDGVINDYDSSFWNSTVQLSDGTQTTLRQLNVKSVRMGPNGNLIVENSDGTLTATLPTAPGAVPSTTGTYNPPGSQIDPNYILFRDPNGGYTTLSDQGISLSRRGDGTLVATTTNAQGQTVSTALPTSGEVSKNLVENVAAAAGKTAEKNSVSDAVSTAKDAMNQSRIYDPLAIDLDGGGVQLTSLAGGIQFDLENTGFAHQTSWVSSGDGFLVYDPTGGPITNGSQLFGENTIMPDGSLATSGFDALRSKASADSIALGVIASTDPLFAALRILKGDGTLLTLEQAGIASIGLINEQVNFFDQYGNQFLDNGSYAKSNGDTGILSDVGLLHETLQSTQSSILVETAAVMALPDMAGAGVIQSLHQAMLHDASGALQNAVSQFASASTDPALFDGLIDQIVFKWTGASSSLSSTYGPHIDTLVADAVFKFMGRAPQFVREQATPYIETSFNKIKESTWATLMAQTHLKDEFDKVIVSSDGYNVWYDLTGLTQSVSEAIADDATAGTLLLQQVNRALFGLDLTSEEGYKGFYTEFATDPDLKEAMDASRPQLSANTLADLTFGIGDGQKTINEYGEGDIVIIGSALSASDVYFHYDGNGRSFELRIKNSTDVLTVQRPLGFNRQGNQDFLPKTRFLFADGTLIGREQIEASFASYAEEDADVDHSLVHGVNETIYANGDGEIWASRDKTAESRIVGGEGTEILHAGDGFSTVIGGVGNQTIYGGAGTSILEAAQGQTTFYTGSGDTTFVFNEGDGEAVIHEASVSSGPKSDTLRLGANLEDVKFYREGEDLRVLVGESDEILVVDQFDPARLGRTINYFEFADGNWLSLDELRQSYLHLPTDNSSNPVVVPDDENYLVELATGRTVFVGDGNNTISAAGDNIIKLGAGHNTVEAGPGVSSISGGSGGTTVIFELGDGEQTISLNGGLDAIQFGEGITASDLLFAVNGADLVITIDGSPDDKITIKGQLSGESARILETFGFADASSLDWADILDGLAIAATANATTDRTSSSADELIASAGAAQTLLLGSGNNTVSVGAGSTAIQSGSGTNTIVYTDTSAALTIEQPSSGTYGAPQDKLVFGHGISAADLAFTASGDDLIISITGETGTITLEDALAANAVKRVEEISFADGSALSFSEYVAMVMAPASYQTAQSAGSTAQTFDFDRGDGVLAIDEDISATGVSDTLNFGTGISSRDLILTRTGANLQISVLGNTSDSILVLNQFANDKRIETFQFADEPDLTFAQLLERGFSVIADVNNNVYDQSEDAADELIRVSASGADLTLGTGDSTVLSTGGGASIELGSGRATVFASGGGNTVYGGSGEDVISLGAGTNTIYAGTGSETFVFNDGDGQLNIFESVTPQVGASDVLQFGEGIDLEDLEVSSDGMNLTLRHEGSTDHVELSNALSPSAAKRIHLFAFSDGTRLSFKDLLARGLSVTIDQSMVVNRSFSSATEFVSVSADDAEYHAGTGDNTINVTADDVDIYAGSGFTDVTSSGDGTDIYLGRGDAIVRVSAGSETIHAGAGFNEIHIGAGGGVHHIDESNANKQYGNSDSIVFGSGLLLDDLKLTQVGTNGADLQIAFEGMPNRVIIHDVFGTTASSPVSYVEFDNGDFVTLSELLERGTDVEISGDYSLVRNGAVKWNQNVEVSGDHNQVYLGSGQNDVAVTGTANTIYGGVENKVDLGADNTYYVGGGHSEITLNGDNDIYGGPGSYSVKLDEGSGDTVIHEASIVGPSTDTVVFGEGIDFEDVQLSSHGSDLTLTLDDGSSIRLEGQLTSQMKHVTRFKTSDGTTMTEEAFEHLSTVDVIISNTNYIDRRTSSLHEHVTVDQAESEVYLGSGNDSVDVTGAESYIELGTGDSEINVSAELVTVQSVRDSGDADINVDAAVDSFTLYEMNQTGGSGIHGADRLHLASALADVVLTSPQGGDLTIADSTLGQSVTIKNGLLVDMKPVEFYFAGGVHLTYSELMALKSVQLPAMTSSGYTIDRSFSTANESISVGGDHNWFYSGTGDDTIAVNGSYDKVYLKHGDAAITESGDHNLLQLDSGSSVVTSAGNYATIESGTSTGTGGSGDNQITVSGDNSMIKSLRGSGDTRIIINSTADNTAVVESQQSSSYAYGADTIVLNSAPQNVKFFYDPWYPGEIIIKDVTTNQQVFLRGMLDGGVLKAVNLEFSDASTASVQTILSSPGTFTVELPTGNNAYVNRQSSTLNETLTIVGSNNSLYLGSGKDIVNVNGQGAYVYDGSGNSVININANNTNVTSARGNDTFVVASGVTSTTLRHQTSAASDGDTLKLSSWNLNDVNLSSTYYDLTMTNAANGATVDIWNELDANYKHVENFQFAGGVNLTRAQLFQQRGVNIDMNNNYQNLNRSSSDAPEIVHMNGYQQTFTGGTAANTISIAGDNSRVNSYGTDTINATGYDDRVYVYGDAVVNSVNPLWNLSISGHAVSNAAGDINIQSSGWGTINLKGNTIYTYAGSHSTEYVLGAGSGNNVVYMDYASSSASDKLRLASGIRPWDLSVTYVGGVNVTVALNATDKIAMNGQYYREVNTFQFANGPTYNSLSSFIAATQVVSINNTQNNAVIDEHATSKGGTIVASGNNVNITGSNGANTITATGSSATINTGSGGSTVTASGGGASIVSGSGSDTINVDKGWGTNTISHNGGGTDKVKLGSNIAAGDVAFFQSGDDLIMSFLNSSDQWTLDNEMTSADHIDRLELSNGKFLSDGDVALVIQNMTTYATDHSISFASVNDVKNSTDLMNIIATSWRDS